MDNKYRELRRRTGLNMTRFAQKYHIPYRTLQAWELGNQEPKEYVYLLLERAVNEDIRNMETFTVAPDQLPDPDVDQLKEVCDKLIDLIRKYEVE